MSISYDEVIGRIIDLRQQQDDKSWEVGALIYYALERMQVKAGQLASETNCSTQHIRDLSKTFGAFPEESERVAELTWTHHKLAARTEEPQKWIQLAAERNLSTREFQKILKGEAVKDELREAEKLWDKLVRVIEAGGPAAMYLEKRLMDYEI